MSGELERMRVARDGYKSMLSKAVAEREGFRRIVETVSVAVNEHHARAIDLIEERMPKVYEARERDDRAQNLGASIREMAEASADVSIAERDQLHAVAAADAIEALARNLGVHLQGERRVDVCWRIADRRREAAPRTAPRSQARP